MKKKGKPAGRTLPVMLLSAGILAADVAALLLRRCRFAAKKEAAGARGDEITFDATLENVRAAVDFVSRKAAPLPFSLKEKNMIEVAVEEIVTNIASYAYGGAHGKATVRASSDSGGLTVTVIDGGLPYDPLKKEDPDVTLPAEKRGIGGYGIFLVKKIMDRVAYEYRDGKNVLTMRKNFSGAGRDTNEIR